MSMKKQMLSRHLRVITADKFKIDLNMPADYPAIDAPITEEGGVRERFLKSVKELPSEITAVHPFSPNGFKESNKKTEARLLRLRLSHAHLKSSSARRAEG